MTIEKSNILIDILFISAISKYVSDSKVGDVVLSKEGDFELRKYQQRIVAETIIGRCQILSA